MSHFSHIKTQFQNLFYLTKSLDRLNIKYQKQEQTSHISESTLSHVNLVIPQSNSYNIQFCWNNQEYELIADKMFWKQVYPIQMFIDRITQQYAGEVVIGESQKLGFQTVTYQQNEDGSNILILERWKEN